MQKVNDIIEKSMIYMVSVIGLGMMLYLTYYCFRYSYSMELEYNQHVFEYVDSLLLHVLGLVSTIVIIWLIYLVTNKSQAAVTSWKRYLPVTMLAVAMFGLSLAWIFGVKNSPANDQGWVLDMVYELQKGNYDVFLPYGFLGAVQHLIGIATIFLGIFNLFHSTNYQIIQVVNALCILAFVFAGWAFVKKFSDKKCLKVVYGVFIFLCFPLYVYTAFVYGEIISITAGMIMVWLIWHYLQSEKLILVLPICICAILGTMSRSNFLILSIASGIVLAWYAISKKSWKHAVVLVCLIAAPLLQEKVMISAYENAAGFEMESGMPKNLWIAMGMQENGDEEANGWYNGYIYQIYNGAEQNGEASKELANAYIRDRATMFKNGTADWKAFYKEKFLTQWNEPTYECFCATDRVESGKTPLVENVYTGPIHRTIEAFLNQYQLIIYLGFLLYIVFSLLKKVPFINYLPLIYVIGGVLFSLLWEASSRYVFPYFVFMIPCAAYGWVCLVDTLWQKKDILFAGTKG